MKIGIDKIAFYSPSFYIEQSDLASFRKIDKDKFLIGLGQDQMAVAPNNEDSVSMGINASHKILDKEDKEKIDLIIFATESSVDQSKSGATFIQEILGINSFTRSIEIKQACYGLTAGIQLGYSHILRNNDSKVLVIGSDIAKYGLNTLGEPTQGAGAVAVLLSKDPRVLEIEDKYAIYSEDIADFFRPNYSEVAVVDGKYSNEKYQEFFLKTYERYLSKYDMSINDFTAICFHVPYTKIGLKSLKLIASELSDKKLFENYQKAIVYNKRVGNIYTGSLYLSLVSLLEQASLKEESRIGLYSYGSGAVGEFFSLKLVKDYKNHLNQIMHETMLNDRLQLTINEYEAIFNKTESDELKDRIMKKESFSRLEKIENHRRIYSKK